MKHLGDKGQVMQQLGALGIGIATLVVVLAVTFLVLAQTGSQAATLNSEANLSVCTSQACNSTRVLTSATATIPDWVPLIILIGIGGIVLALVAAFGMRK